MKSLPMNRRRKMTEAWKKVDNNKVVSKSCYLFLRKLRVFNIG
jgi:hypothetical protein